MCQRYWPCLQRYDDCILAIYARSGSNESEPYNFLYQEDDQWCNFKNIDNISQDSKVPIESWLNHLPECGSKWTSDEEMVEDSLFIWHKTPIWTIRDPWSFFWRITRVQILEWFDAHMKILIFFGNGPCQMREYKAACWWVVGKGKTGFYQETISTHQHDY